jgi:hypothetical protein
MSVLPAPDPWPKLFQIGVKPVDMADWIDVDDRLAAYLEQKQQLFAQRPDEVFAAQDGTEAAQGEVLAMLAAHLFRRFPGLYRREGDDVTIVPAGRRVGLGARGVRPLMIAASLVQEDLVLMRRGDEAWRIAAGAVCFPSSWRLAEKAGRPIHEVHAPVPGFGGGTRGADLIARMFDNMRPGVVGLRWNWSLYGDDALFHPHDSATPRFGDDGGGPAFLRLERQTLQKLPESGDVLFTIRIYVDPIDAVARQPEAGRIAAALAAQLEALDDAQLAYKGLTLERERLLVRLREMTER